jgi:hypothetical protein
MPVPQASSRKLSSSDAPKQYTCDSIGFATESNKANSSENLAEYFTKHHSPAHHKLMRSRYLLELHKPVPA